MAPVIPVRLPFRWNLWISARLLPVFAKRGSLEKILRLATPGQTIEAYSDIPPDEIIAAVKKAVARPWRMRGRRCLREGLLAFRFLSLAGHRPVLHFGVLPETVGAEHPRAHCWLSLDGNIVMNPATEPMLDLFSYDGRDAAPAVKNLKLADAVDG